MSRFALARAGARSIRVYPGKKIDFSKVDGLLIGGGDDIDVKLYDQDLVLETRLDPKRDALEQELLALAEQRNLPVLGICRGAQMLNVYYGGSLVPDIHALFEDLPRMRTALPRKWVNLRVDSRLHGILGKKRLRVNSLHRQAIGRGQGAGGLGAQAVGNSSQHLALRRAVPLAGEFRHCLTRHVRFPFGRFSEWMFAQRGEDVGDCARGPWAS